MSRMTSLSSTLRPLALLAMFAGSVLMSSASAQTLQLKYTFEDGPGTTTVDDPSSAIYPLSLNMFNAAAVAVDLHGPAFSGVQNQGTSLNLSTNPIAGNLGGSYAVVQNSSALGALGTITNFTATVWLKMPNLETNILNQGSRIYNLMGSGITDIGGVNSIGFQPQLANSSTVFSPKVVMRGVVGTTFITPAIYFDFPTNQWLFFALTYDTVSGNACLYYGSEASPAKLYEVKNIGAGTNFNFSGTPSFSLGDRPSRGRSFPGWIGDARFYTGSGNVNFIENVRKSSVPVVVSGLVPDGSTLMEGTNTLSFTATSPNGVNANGVKVYVNGTDVSSSLLFAPTTGGQIVTYTNLPVNPTLIQQANLNGVNVNINVTDVGGIFTSNSYVYDAFSPANFTWEAEDYDFGGGLFIDNPVYTFVGPGPDTYYQEQTSYQNFTDASDNGNLSGPSRIYRDPLENVETEYSVGGGINGGQSVGELMRQKVLDAYDVTNIANEVNVGYFDGGTGSGLPNWMNYTRTYPPGDYNVYLRAADGAGSLSASLDMVTDGFGTDSQTTTNIGVFNFGNTGGWDSFAWVPLRDGNGNLLRVSVAGQNTIRLTAGTAGGGNVNFMMLTPANTNLPAISNVYPNGTNMFQPAAALTFTATSPAGITINPSGISATLTIQTLTGQTTVTNITTANGLVVTGSATSKNVSVPLTTNLIYSAVLNVTDVNGSPASSSISFDTLSPNYTWEAEDYDYNGGQFFDNPPTGAPTGAYMGLSAIPEIDSFTNVDTSLSYAYRGSGGLGDQADGDTPPRLQYINSALTSYNVGWNDTGDWGNYTRTYPAGIYNVFARAANGSSGTISDTMSVVTSGWGTLNQATTNLGTFSIPGNGNWQGYIWSPLRDAGGNLVKLTLGGSTNTFRVTANSGGGGNLNFFALFPANTNLPAINGIYPDGKVIFEATNKLVFNVTSTVGVTSNNVVVTVNGVTATNLVFSGSSLNWNVTDSSLQPDLTYTITIAVTDLNGNQAQTSTSFDTFSTSYYTWEAEDFDYNGGQFIDNPQTNQYAGLPVIVDVDTHQVNFGGADLYRPNGMDTEVNGDLPRAQYLGTGNTNLDYTMGYYSVGSWANYTRHYRAGSYNVYARLAGGATVPTSAILSEVTSGWGTMDQTTNFLGTFNVDNNGWEAYEFSPLRDDAGNLVTVTFNGSTNTLQLGVPAGAGSDVNANFLMLVPASSSGSFAITVSSGSGSIVIGFPTQIGSNYQLLYKNNLTDSSWTAVGSPVAGTGSVESISQPVSGASRFYRVQAH